MRKVLILTGLFAISCQLQVPNLNGSYRLVEWKGIRPDKSIAYPYGQDAQGALVLSSDGYMSLHLAKNNRPLLGTDDYDSIGAEQIREAFKGYFSYHGNYELIADELLQFDIHGCKNPDWIGRKLKRRYMVSGDSLILRTDSVIGMDHVLTWVRIKN